MKQDGAVKKQEGEPNGEKVKERERNERERDESYLKSQI